MTLRDDTSTRLAESIPPLQGEDARDVSRQVAAPTLRGEVGATVRLAGPVVIAQLGMMTMGLVDILMVGPLGAEALAAVSLGNAIFFSVMIFFGGILMALDTMVSQAVGARLTSSVGALLWQGIWMCLVMGAVLNLVFLDVEWVLLLLRQDEAVASSAASYLSARSFSAVPFLLFAAMRGLLNGLGRTRPVMVITIFANLLNVAADAILIHGLVGVPALGVVGAGAATSIVRWFMLFALVGALFHKSFANLDLAFRRPDLTQSRKILSLGLPIGSQLLAEVGVFSVTGILVGWLGAEALAQHQIALTCVSFAFMVPLGIGVAANIRVGQAMGRGDPDGAMRAGRIALGLGVGFMLVPSVLFLLLPGLFVRAFSQDLVIVAGAVALLRIAVIFQLADGLQAVAAGCLRGAGDTKTPLFANLFSFWALGLPIGAWLAFGADLGAPGLWWGLTVALLVLGGILTLNFLLGGWRRRRRVV